MGHKPAPSALEKPGPTDAELNMFATGTAPVFIGADEYLRRKNEGLNG